MYSLSEATVEQIIAIITTCSVSCFVLFFLLLFVFFYFVLFVFLWVIAFLLLYLFALLPPGRP